MSAPALTVIETPAAPQPVAEVYEIPVDMIQFGERLRPIDQDWALALGQIMQAEGQRTPIEVCRLPGQTGFMLTAGGHRLAGRIATRQPTIRAIFGSANAVERRLAEVSENLWRKELGPLDRAAFVAQLHDTLRAKAGIAPDANLHQLAANKRWKHEADDASRTMRLAYGWAEEAAQHLRVDRATIYRDLQLYRGLAPDVMTGLQGHAVAGKAGELRALAKLPAADQRRIMTALLSGEARSVGEAAAMLTGKVKPAPDAKRLSAFLGSYERMGAAERRAALRTLAKLKLPAGVSITFAEKADA